MIKKAYHFINNSKQKNNNKVNTQVYAFIMADATTTTNILIL
jgi:hypothetical protein